MRKAPIATFLLLTAFSSDAQEPQELLVEVDGPQARRLEAYNAVFLQKELYFAERHRIVSVNTHLLLQDQDIAVTPFDDVTPIRINNTGLQRIDDDVIHWTGRMTGDPIFDEIPAAGRTRISAFAWDMDDSGNALLSALNRFEFSPLWSFDESGNAVLETPSADASDLVFPGPPPQTAQEIERHKALKLKRLQKHAFYSVSAVFAMPDGGQYVLEPLEFTPRYSVIYEIKPETDIPVLIDLPLGQADPRSDADRIRAQEYVDFLNEVPEEEGKAVRGDVR